MSVNRFVICGQSGLALFLAVVEVGVAHPDRKAMRGRARSVFFIE